jgi:hypothetical protein
MSGPDRISVVDDDVNACTALRQHRAFAPISTRTIEYRLRASEAAAPP